MAKGWAIPKGRYYEMKIDKYYIQRGYSNNRFRVVRVKVNKFLMKDQQCGLRETVSRHPHKVEK